MAPHNQRNNARVIFLPHAKPQKARDTHKMQISQADNHSRCGDRGIRLFADPRARRLVLQGKRIAYPGAVGKVDTSHRNPSRPKPNR